MGREKEDGSVSRFPLVTHTFPLSASANSRYDTLCLVSATLSRLLPPSKAGCSARCSCNAPLRRLASMSDTRPPGRFHTAEVAGCLFPSDIPRKSLRIANVSLPLPRSPLDGPPFVLPLRLWPLPRSRVLLPRARSFVPTKTKQCHFSLRIWKFHIRLPAAPACSSLKVMQSLGQLIALVS